MYNICIPLANSCCLFSLISTSQHKSFSCSISYAAQLPGFVSSAILPIEINFYSRLWTDSTFSHLPHFSGGAKQTKVKGIFSITFLINLQATKKVLVTSVLSVLRPVSKPVGAVTFTGLWTKLLTTSRQSK